MNESVDPRIQARRREVHASRSRGSARRIVWILGAVALLATVAWFVQSPAMSVSEIRVEGVVNAPVGDLLKEAGVLVGEPLLLVSAVEAEQVLRSNPWVADVAVSKIFPNTVEVIVLERRPTAVLEHRTGDVLVAADGMVVAELTGEVPTAYGRVLASTDPAGVGEKITDQADLAAVRFLVAWEGSPAVVSQLDGDLWAEVDGFSVRLGGPTEMEQKARSLAAVLLEGQVAGSLINVIAPTRPTVSPPGTGDTGTTPDP